MSRGFISGADHLGLASLERGNALFIYLEEEFVHERLFGNLGPVGRTAYTSLSCSLGNGLLPKAHMPAKYLKFE